MNHSNYLLLDIGNSRLKWNIWQHGATQFSRETQVIDYKAQPLASILNDQWQGIKDSIDEILIANVAGEEIAEKIDTWCAQHFGINPTFILTRAVFQSVRNGYHNYQALGVDRWLAVVAASKLCPAQNVIVIDCGTATTLDALTCSGLHRAGPIVPGRQMMLQALENNTAELKITSDAGMSVSVFAENTQNAILCGVNFAASGALNTVVEEMRRKLFDETGINEVRIIVTGGAAAQLIPLTQLKDFSVESDLVLIGLRVMADEEP